MKKLKVLDLFSGIGGFSLGLERTDGFVAFCEIDEHARKVLKKHWPEVGCFQDVTKLSYQDDLFIYDGEIHFEEKIGVICGGFPCQDISVAGKQKGLEGERSGLWKEYARLIKEIKPRYAIIENVPNLRSKGLTIVMQDLWEIGYDCEWHIISARSVGAPHLRERIWIIAYPDSSNIREQSRWCTRKEGKEEVQLGVISKNGNVTYSNNFRFWKPFTSEKAQQEWWAETTSSISHWKETQSIICGVDDGISRWVDKYRKQRIKQLGNSVVPQIPQLIGQAILDYENK